MRIFIILVCLIVCFNCISANALPDDDDKPLSDSGTNSAQADTAIVILKEKQSQSAGIQSQVMQAVQLQPEFIAYGTVLSLEPLMLLHQQYLAAQAQQNSAKAKFTEAYLNLSRTERLHQQDIVSTRRLQEQHAQWQSDKANLNVSSYQQQSILVSSRLEWGDILTDWMVLAQPKVFEQFLTHRSQLLQITLPANMHLSPNIRSIDIDEHGQRDSALKASLISPSPRVDPISQGERFFFKTEGRFIPFGTHITAWIAGEGQGMTGVFIPKSAVVWHLGQAFVFIKTAESQFSRRALTKCTPDKQGGFVTENVQPGEAVVTIGAQTLLSQQLKAMIPHEDD